MGIPGLWDILRPAGKSRSLTHLTVVDGFLRNSSGKRAYRIGIDASIWFFHANGGQGGENPELRTLYFRCCRLLSLPILPLFVFDGALRPSQKRGKHIGKNQHWLVSGMREIIDAFGFEWWTAPGEAEAELAYFNDIGVIDAILSDDVDNFLFGAKVVIRNPSATLTGTQTHVRKTGQEEKDDGQHVVIYRAADIESHPDVGLRRGGLILIGLMSGGDYNTTGLMGIGTSIAHALAKCGYGDQLVDHLEQLKDNKSHIPIALEAWREAVRRDLRGPSRVTELLKRRFPAKAKAITDDFPVIQDVCSYAAPVTSFTLNRDITMIQWTKKPNLGKIAGLCERHFEWGVREVIIKRFRTTVWQGAVLRALIGAVLKQDEKSTPTSTPRKRPSPNVPVTPSTRLADAFRQLHATSPSRPTQPGQASTQEALVSNVSHGGKASETIANIDVSKLILRIHSSRTHPSTDDMLEYRLEIDPGQLVTQAHTGIQDTRLGPDAILDPNFEDLDSDEEGAQKAKKPPPDPLSTLRIWTPAVIVKMACPELVEEFEALQEAKAAKKATK
ncbi:PIN domain-like protein, partial [Dacryopinax primogenitus]